MTTPNDSSTSSKEPSPSHPSLRERLKGEEPIALRAETQTPMGVASEETGNALGRCWRFQYEHAEPHAQIHDIGQTPPPFPCVNWQPLPSPSPESSHVSRGEEGAPSGGDAGSVEAATCKGFEAAHLAPWLREKLAAAESALKSREESARIWRSGDDKSWAAAAALHPSTAGKPISKAQRIKNANAQGMIAMKCRREVEMFKAVLAFLARSEPLTSALSTKPEVAPLPPKGETVLPNPEANASSVSLKEFDLQQEIENLVWATEQATPDERRHAIMEALSAAMKHPGVADVEELYRTQAWADHEGLLQCRALLNVKDGENLYDAISSLSARLYKEKQSASGLNPEGVEAATRQGLEATLKAAFDEGYHEGYLAGTSDQSSFEFGSGSKHFVTRQKDQRQAWGQSDTRSALQSSLATKPTATSAPAEGQSGSLDAAKVEEKKDALTGEAQQPRGQA